MTLKNLLTKKNIPYFALAILMIFGICSILISYKALGISIVVACLMFILETVLSVCFNRIPLWIHGIIAIAQIVAGIITSKLVFMILMTIVYAISVVFLYIWDQNE